MSVPGKADARAVIPIIVVFAVVSCFSVVFRNTMNRLNVDQAMFITGNILLFIITMLSFAFYKRALLAGSTHSFLRNVYAGMGLKFFLCLVTAFIYIFSVGSAVNKPGLFGLMFLYFLYTFLEVAILMKLSRQIRQNKNG